MKPFLVHPNIWGAWSLQLGSSNAPRSHKLRSIDAAEAPQKGVLLGAFRYRTSDEVDAWGWGSIRLFSY